MEAGIVGLPNVGKSTLFNALTAAGIASENYPFCTIEPNVGVVAVPDKRLQILASLIPPEKVIPATLRMVDIAGLVRGASQGEGLGNKFLSHIRNVDAIMHVVRCFEDPDVTHVEGNVDPLKDIQTIDTELILSDLVQAEAALHKAQRAARSGDKDAKARAALLPLIVKHLEEGHSLRSMELTEAQKQVIADFGFITAKRVLYIANVDENDLQGRGPWVSKVREHAQREQGAVVPVCAKLESELAELDHDDQQELLESVGIEEPALAVLAREAYALLGLQSYFTAGPKEIRAWTIPIGATAPQAAGVIHTDFERGFIRAEIYSVADLETYKTEAAIRLAGKMRTEGKDYIMQDADVCNFLFNV